MTQDMVIQGRNITAVEIGLIHNLMAEHSGWGRTRLSEELCRCWNWRNGQGRLKDMAARTLLLKLERRGFVKLPARRRPSSNAFRNRRVPLLDHAIRPIRGSLADLRPLCVSIDAPGSPDAGLFQSLLAQRHYLGHRNLVFQGHMLPGGQLVAPGPENIGPLPQLRRPRELLPHPRLRLHRAQERRQRLGRPPTRVLRLPIRADDQHLVILPQHDELGLPKNHAQVAARLEAAT
jgi:hypothetical protein